MLIYIKYEGMYLTVIREKFGGKNVEESLICSEILIYLKKIQIKENEKFLFILFLWSLSRVTVQRPTPALTVEYRLIISLCY